MRHDPKTLDECGVYPVQRGKDSLSRLPKAHVLHPHIHSRLRRVFHHRRRFCVVSFPPPSIEFQSFQTELGPFNKVFTVYVL